MRNKWIVNERQEEYFRFFLLGRGFAVRSGERESLTAVCFISFSRSLPAPSRLHGEASDRFDWFSLLCALRVWTDKASNGGRSLLNQFAGDRQAFARSLVAQPSARLCVRSHDGLTRWSLICSSLAQCISQLPKHFTSTVFLLRVSHCLFIFGIIWNGAILQRHFFSFLSSHSTRFGQTLLSLWFSVSLFFLILFSLLRLLGRK